VRRTGHLFDACISAAIARASARECYDCRVAAPDASRFEDESLQRLEATVLLVSRTFVRLELPQPWAPTTIPLPDAELEKGQTVRIAGHPDEKLDQMRSPEPGESVEKQPGFRVLVVVDGERHLEVTWPTEAPDEPPPIEAGTVAADEDDWSDV
jgi:hypothetical protein